MKKIGYSLMFLALLLGSCHKSKTESVQPSSITKEMAYEGVNNYCHSEYDWSMAKEGPSMMYLQMGEETDSTYHVVFRSYTGAFVHFYVDKTSGTTRMVESVTSLKLKKKQEPLISLII